MSLGWVEGETGRGWGMKVTECLVESFLLIPIESMDMRNTREVEVCLFNAVLDYGELLQEKKCDGLICTIYFLDGKSEVSRGDIFLPKVILLSVTEVLTMS